MRSDKTFLSEICKRARQKSDGLLMNVNAVLFFLSSVKLVCEIALMSLLGQGVLAALAGAKRDTNFFYQLLKVLTRPFTAAARFISPRQVGDHQVGFVAFFLVAVLWLVVTFEKVNYCIANKLQGCQ
jgi:hypothetical protein